MSYVSDDYVKTIVMCWHCGEEVGKTKMLCENCTTKEKRLALCKLNAEIMPEHYPCKHCRQ